MEEDDRSPRRIETLDDVVAVLESRSASFIELMECVTVAAAAKSWQLRHRAAERAFAEIKVDSPMAATRLVSAAAVVVDCYLRSANSLRDLPTSLDDADRWMVAHRSKLDLAGASFFAEERLQLLAELHVLLSASEPDAKVRLCSRLRKVDRADLGIEAVRPIANRERSNLPALTTLGAAYCDVREFERAERVLRAALKVQPSDTQARVALSRVLQESGRLSESLDAAKMAFAMKPDSFTAHRLLAAASASGDEESLDQAVEEVERAAMYASSGPPDVYLLTLAAEALVDQGRLEDVSDIVKRIAATGISLSGATAKRFSDLKMALRSASTPKLFPELPPR